MAEAMTPYEHDDDYSVVVLGTMTSPGKVTFPDLARIPEWDDQKAKGKTGASTTLNDPKPPGKFQAVFRLAGTPGDGMPSDFDRWEDFQRLVQSMVDGPKPFALPIYHPDLARLRYTEVTNGGISGPVHDGQGGQTYTVTFKEYRPPKPKPAAKPTAKPGGQTAGSNANSKPDPNAKAKAELAQLVAEARQP